MLPLFRQYNLAQGHRFTIVAEEAAFEYSLLEYPFAFWQYGRAEDCAAIPGDAAAGPQMLDHLMAVSPSHYYADSGFLYYQPLFYQAYSELGYCAYDFEHHPGLLDAVPEPSYRSFAPRDAQLVFRPEVMADVITWLRYEGRGIVYIYGGNDPWIAGALEPERALDALVVVQPGANHQVRISDLDRRDLVIGALERWLSLRIGASELAASRPAPDRERF